MVKGKHVCGKGWACVVNGGYMCGKGWHMWVIVKVNQGCGKRNVMW